MIKDKFDNPIFQQEDLLELMYQGYTNFEDLIVEPSKEIELFQQNLGKTLHTVNNALENISVEDFDRVCQDDWFIPDEYKLFDVDKFCLSKCNSIEEANRVKEELAVFKEKNMIILLQTLKYLVDTFREHNVLWGVGRGSSVSSYVLYLLEVHRIDSIKYKLDWHEFLR